MSDERNPDDANESDDARCQFSLFFTDEDGNSSDLTPLVRFLLSYFPQTVVIVTAIGSILAFLKWLFG